MISNLRAELKQWFGFDEFRPGQLQVVQALCSGQSALAIMPTGGGKSLCYMLPAVLSSGTAVVITPLISLMQDQVRTARSRRIAAEAIHSGQDGKRTSHVVSELLAGELDLLYVSPERMCSASFQNTLRRAKVSMFIVDEAHCLAEWGPEFRPEYHQIGDVIRQWAVPVGAFTATATKSTEEEIVNVLGLKSPVISRQSFNRPNLYYGITSKWVGREMDQISEFVGAQSGCGIVYRCTRDQVADTVRCLIRDGHDALPYHAGMDAPVRAQYQADFLADRTRIIVATIAFGMGIDKSSVRWVLHADLPKNIEGYYQETGRAGRDGKPASCTLLYSVGDIPLTRSFIDRTRDQGHRARLYGQFLQVVKFAQSKECRRAQLLRYFGESHPGNCGNCDVCLHGKK
jgi:ATP-dependent DNA helicase RecQ